jgi:hypothetical protein
MGRRGVGGDLEREEWGQPLTLDEIVKESQAARCRLGVRRG